MPKPVPATTPPSDSVFAEMVSWRVAPREIAPAVWVRFAVPVNVRLEAKAIGFVIAASTAASSVPPLAVKVPGVPPEPPKAKVAEPAESVPWVKVVPPV